MGSLWTKVTWEVTSMICWIQTIQQKVKHHNRRLHFWLYMHDRNQNNLCDITLDLQTPIPFNKLSHFSDPPFPWSVTHTLWTAIQTFIKVIPRLRSAIALSRSFAYVGSSWAWNYCLPQSLHLELLSLSPLQLRKHPKTVVLKLWATAPLGAAASSRELLQFFTIYLFNIILFQFTDVDILQSILDIRMMVPHAYL